MIVELSERAEVDLERILDDLADRAGKRVAIRIVERIERRCMSLDQFPERGARLRLDGLPEFRFLVEKPYLIAYRVREGTVEIIAVVHGARDIEAVLRDGKA